jgi:hypothetical protein
MSEYSLHEFRTINRTLSRAEQAEIDTWSSRSKATSTGAKFVYNYGSFKHDPEKCLLSYFDIMLHYTNYGCSRVMFRFPKNVVDFKALRLYEYDIEDDYERSIKIRQKGEYVVVDIEENCEEGYDSWLDCEDTLDSITPLWTDIVNGDYRCLYLAWVHFTQLALEYEVLEEDLEEPPVPAGLQNLTTALDDFTVFWGIQDDLIAAASKASPVQKVIEIDVKKAISLLTDDEKSTFLLKLVQDELQVKTLLIKRLEILSGATPPPYQNAKRGIHTIAELQTEERQLRTKIERDQAELKRRTELEIMVKKEPKMWAEVYQNLDLKIGSSYDNAVKLLVNLKDLADFQGKNKDFKAKMDEIIINYGKSTALKNRLGKVKLI